MISAGKITQVQGKGSVRATGGAGPRASVWLWESEVNILKMNKGQWPQRLIDAPGNPKKKG